MLLNRLEISAVLALFLLGCHQAEPAPQTAPGKTPDSGAPSAPAASASAGPAVPGTVGQAAGTGVAGAPGAGATVAPAGSAAIAPDKPRIRQSLEIKGQTLVSWTDLKKAGQENTKGLALHKAKRYAKALDHYQKAWEIDPNQVLARYNAACAHALMGNAPSAIALLGQIRQLDGFAARKQLRFARIDADLKSLWADPNFVTTTDVPDPAPAFMGKEGLDLGLASDQFESLCIWANQDDNLSSCQESWFEIIECATGKPLKKEQIVTSAICDKQEDSDLLNKLRQKAELRGDAYLQSLGMIEWGKVDPAMEARAKAWYEKNLEKKVLAKYGEESLGIITISPKGSFVAFLHAHSTANDMEKTHFHWTIVPAATVLAP